MGSREWRCEPDAERVAAAGDNTVVLHVALRAHRDSWS